MSNVSSTVPATRTIVPEYRNLCHLDAVARNSATRGEFQTVISCRVIFFVLGADDIMIFLAIVTSL